MEEKIVQADVKYLKNYYEQSNGRRWKDVGSTDLATSNTKRGTSLLCLSHGSVSFFNGYSPEKFLDWLGQKGLAEKSFTDIYLLGCNLAASTDPAVNWNFARSFCLLLRQRSWSTVVRAPLGLLRGVHEDKTTDGMTYVVTTEMVVRVKEGAQWVDRPYKAGIAQVLQ